MKIVLDSNILFSALISGKEIYLDILQKIRAYTPDFSFIEISKYEGLRKKGFIKVLMADEIFQLLKKL